MPHFGITGNSRIRIFSYTRDTDDVKARQLRKILTPLMFGPAPQSAP
jgi:hypothetical protein